MKINNKDFNKLSQLDRIEFLTKTSINKNFYHLTENWISIYLILIFMLFIAKIIHPLLILICFIYLFITFFMNRFLKEKEESKLCEEYFKVEVKKK